MAYNPNVLITPKEDKMGEIKKGKVEKLCPFRKRVYYMASNSEHIFNTYVEKSEFTEEEFLSCIKEKCMLYDEVLNICKR